jgi:hypothetical protein
MTSSINPVASTEARYLDALIETMEIAPSDAWRALSVDAINYQRSISSDVVPLHLISAAEAAVRRYWCV